MPQSLLMITQRIHLDRRCLRLPKVMLFAISAFIALIETSNSKAHAAVFISRECSEEKQVPDCEKNGSIKYIYIYDSIEMETADDVARVNGAIPIGEPFPIVYLNSEGGSGQAAYQIGRILRQRSASVESKDMFFPNRMPSCNSACALIAMGSKPFVSPSHGWR